MTAICLVTRFATFVANAALSAANDWDKSKIFSALPLLGGEGRGEGGLPFRGTC